MNAREKHAIAKLTNCGFCQLTISLPGSESGSRNLHGHAAFLRGLRLMKPRLICAILALMCTQANADMFGTFPNQFEIEIADVGDPGNAADNTGNPTPAGSVDYAYSIGKFEVSRDMIEKASHQGDLDISLFDMTDFGGNASDRPATGVSWNEAARFTNWLNTSRGLPPAYRFATQPGDSGYDANSNVELWDNDDLGFDPSNPLRNSLARYALPSTNEWYKAAFYDPNANGGSGGYWDFPTGSDVAPRRVSSGDAPSTAVYGHAINRGPAEIMHAGGLSPYNVMGLGGNVSEWVESESPLRMGWRGLHGGNWFGGPYDISVSSYGGGIPTSGNAIIGFRVVSVPEPSPHLFVVSGLLGLLLGRRAYPHR